MFSMSKIVCADARGKACKICAIGTPQCGGKKKGCVLSRAKVILFFRNVAFFAKKIAQSFYIFETHTKTRGLFLETPLVSQCIPLFLGERSPCCFACPHRGRFLTRRDTPLRTPSRASRTQRVRISCLHPSPPHLSS